MFKLLIIKAIKLISPILMLAAIALDIDYLYLNFNQQEISEFISILVIIGSFALIIHLIEGIIGSLLARNQAKNPLFYGIYVFLIGTIGLLELWKKEEI